MALASCFKHFSDISLLADQKQVRGSIKVFSNVDGGIQIFPMFSTVCVFGRYVQIIIKGFWLQ